MTYTYDNDSRLTQAADATGTYAFSYDNLGRLGGTTTDYSFLTSRALTTSYSYDAASNRATLTDAEGGITSYSYDTLNRLASATPGGGTTVGFKYDPFGRRIEKVSSTTTSIYVYDGDNLIEEINSAGSAVARYTQGLGIDEPLAMLRSGVTSYYEADGLGSVTSLSNSSGTVAASYDFDSYGNLTSSTGTLTNSFRYTAREFDSETGLYYYRARYYDPTSGRFLSEDPIRLGGRINYYAYVRNSPIGRIDPFGLCDEKNCLKGLKEAKQNTTALNRADAAWKTIQAAADPHGIDPGLLAAIAIRETGFRNVNENDGAGVGVGVFQITISERSAVTGTEAQNLGWAANYAANMISSNMDSLSEAFPNFTPGQLLQATARIETC